MKIDHCKSVLLKIAPFALMFILFTCNRTGTRISYDEYIVISAFLNESVKNIKVENSSFQIDSFYIVDSTTFSAGINHFSDNEAEQYRTDFINKNKTAGKFKRKFKLAVPYRIIGNKEVKEIRECHYKCQKYQNWTNAGGSKSFSRVGFNKKRTKALFYYAGYGGPLAACGLIVYMQKTDGEWKVDGIDHLWGS